MSKLWNTLGVPHKGWVLVDVIDIREDGQTEEETDYETCTMCGNEKIRFVHIIEHPDVNEEFRVGCICAEKMTQDYINPKRKEKELRNESQRKLNWLKKVWKVSANGNFFLNVKGHHILIFRDKKSKEFKIKIDDQFGSKDYKTLREAKLSIPI